MQNIKQHLCGYIQLGSKLRIILVIYSILGFLSGSNNCSAQTPSYTQHDSLEAWLSAEVGEGASHQLLLPDTLPNGDLQYGKDLKLQKEEEGYSFWYKGKRLKGEPTVLKGYYPREVYCICTGNNATYLFQLKADYIPTGLNASIAKGILLNKKGYQYIESYYSLKPIMIRKKDNRWVLVQLERDLYWSDVTSCATVYNVEFLSLKTSKITMADERFLFITNRLRAGKITYFFYNKAPEKYDKMQQIEYYLEVGCSK